MTEKNIRRNFIMNALLSVCGILFPLIEFRYASRILLPAGVGKVSIATSVIAYFTMLAGLGIPTYGIRAVAAAGEDRAKRSQIVHELMGINMVMVLVSYLLLASAVMVIPKLAEEKLLYVVVSVPILMSSAGMEWLYKGMEQYTYITVRSILCRLVALAALFLLIRSEQDYVIYGGVTVFAVSASGLLNLIYARKYVDFRRPEDCDWRRHLRPVMTFFAISCAATVYTHLDELMLGFMTTDADVGYYHAAVRIKSILISLVTALGAVLLPRSSRYVENGEMDKFRSLTRKAFRFVLLAAVPLTVFFVIYARECILFLSGEAFLPAVGAMQIILPTVLLVGLSNLFGIQILVPLGREKKVLQSEIAGAAVDFILNLILIPRWGAAGAAAGTLAAEAVVLLVQGYALKEEIRTIAKGYTWGKLTVALLAACAAGVWVKVAGWQPLLTLLIAGIGFFGVYIGYLLWQKEEILTETWTALKAKIRKQGRRK